VTGEAGLGKTALVENFLGRHRDNATLWAAQGRCIEQYGTGEAYLPLLEALEQLSQRVGVDEFRRVLERYAPDWLAKLHGSRVTQIRWRQSRPRNSPSDTCCANSRKRWKC